MNQDKNCCVPPNNKGGVISGIIYGVIPHFFCIAFILFSVIGATVGTVIMKRFLLIPYFFHLLVLFSIFCATISAILYLRRNNCLSCQGTKRKWKYLTFLYGTTIFINIFMFLVVFPVVANLNSGEPNQNDNISIKVDIPCSGHAYLIIDELKKVDGVSSAKFRLPNIFDINYDKEKTSTEKILSLNIFKTYEASLQ